MQINLKLHKNNNNKQIKIFLAKSNFTKMYISSTFLSSQGYVGIACGVLQGYVGYNSKT